MSLTCSINFKSARVFNFIFIKINNLVKSFEMSKFFKHTNGLMFLVATGFLLSVNFGAAAQEKDRTRVIAAPTPTPKKSPPVVPTPKPTVSPIPTPSPTPAPVQTLADLQGKIRLSLSRPEFRHGSYGVKITSLQTGKTIYEENAEKYLMPASNMKSFTIAAALERLSPDFRFVTSVYANSMPDASGTIRGDLRIYGRGDISVSTAFYDKDYYKGLDALADRIAQAGVKRIEGSLVGDETYFSGSPIPEGWEWDDLQWYYGAEISALPVNDNAVDLTVKPANNGAPCLVQMMPFNSVMHVINHCMTTDSGVSRTLTIKKDLDQNVLDIAGSLPVGDKGFSSPVAVSQPSELFVQLLRQRLEQKGIVVTGQTRIYGEKDKQSLPFTTALPVVEIARLESFPFSLIAAKTMKPSQNMYTETILRVLGEQAKTLNLPNLPADNPLINPTAPSAQKGLFAVRNFTGQIGIPADSVLQYDGCGLSRHNLVTVNSLIQLYTYMSRQSRYAQVWRDSLPVGGVDGTLKSRFSAAPTAGNVRAKTGTIDQVSALSGYLTTAAGEPLVFSIIVNGVTNSKTRTSTIDEIVNAAANFNGKIN